MPDVQLFLLDGIFAYDAVLFFGLLAITTCIVIVLISRMEVNREFYDP